MMARYKRRLVSLPLLLVLDVATLLLAPLLFGGAFVLDLLFGFGRKRFMRLVVFWMTGLAIETIGVLGSFGLWIVSGFGLLRRTTWHQHALSRLQVWWASALLAGTAKVFSTTYQVEGLEQAGLTQTGPHESPGPVILATRHISHGDAVLPSYVLGRLCGMNLRHVLKRELTWGPAIDLVGHRQPNHFVDRNRGGVSETQSITKMVQGLGPNEAAVIFPEGTFFTPARKERVVQSLQEKDPDLAERADKLKHMLPPRPGGTLALLKGAPDADIVFMAHVGFEPFSSIPEILRNVPFDRPVRVRVWRVARHEVPSDPKECTRFLFQWWERLDTWVEDQRIAATGD